MAKLQWVTPSLVVDVAFVEWTRDGLLRHPRLIGVREDKNAKEVVREPRARVTASASEHQKRLLHGLRFRPVVVLQFGAEVLDIARVVASTSRR